MVHLVLLFAVMVLDLVHGRPPLPPLPMKDGCFMVSAELSIFSVEREAVVLAFPIFQRVLQVRNIASPTAQYLINRSSGTEGVAYGGEGHVQQHERQLWLLPAQASDSGEYTCTFRNETYCVTGSITLVVYKSDSMDVEKLSYPMSTMLGEKEAKFDCPALSHFNLTEQVEWYKDSDPAACRQRGRLLFPVVNTSHQGLYTCQLTVLINNQQYKVSRKILIHVQDPIIQPPVIVSPHNGAIYESPHGSGLELFCKALTGCQTAGDTAMEWLVNGQSVESSYLDGRALQGGRRVTRVKGGCHIELSLVILALTEEDMKTELKCIAQNDGGRQEAIVQLQLEDSTSTWLVVAAVALSCFLTVVSVFLYALYKSKNKRKADYFLARQNSTF